MNPFHFRPVVVRRVGTGIVLTAIALFCWQLWRVSTVVPSPRSFHDSKYFFRVAQSGYLSRGLWGGDRSPLPSLVFKFCDLDPERIQHFLTLLSAFSWAALAFAVAHCLRALPVRILGALLVLSLALSRHVLQWNDTVLGESLALSCLASFVAVALTFLVKRGLWAIPLALTGALLALSRDSNAYLILLLGAFLFCDAAVRFRRGRSFRASAAVAVLFVCEFVVSNASSNSGERWQYPLTNVIVMRVLRDERATRQFAALGMPTPDALRARRPRRFYDSNPSLAPFREWLEVHGKRSYIQYLLSHPRYLFGAVDFSEVLEGALERYSPRGLPCAQPSALESMWAASNQRAGLALIALSAALAAFLSRREASPALLLGLVLAALTYPHGLVVWHGDAMEVPRHGLPVAVQLQIAFVLLMVGISDALFVKPRRKAVEQGALAR